MARLSLTVQSPPGFWPTLALTAGAADFTWVSAGADFADGFSFVNTGREILLARQDTAVAKTVTISSVALQPYNRTGDITAYSMALNDLAWFGPFKPAGWNQLGTNLIYGAAESADVFLVVCRLPVLN